MFKKTQNYLLINHPLLWNIKVVPLAIFLILCNIIFFILGYVNGAIDFTETNTRFRSDVDDIVIFFSITIMILTLIIWLVNYFKNNAFKSYYPKNNFSIFKEWIITLIVCMMLLSFPMSYFLAKDVRVRSYYTEQEARERTEILSLTSLFTTGSFKQSDYETKDSAGVILDVLVADIEYRGKKYPLSSLLNKNIKTFGFNDKEADSILRNRGLDWLVNNQKDSVLHLFDKFFELADEHHLKGNISSEKWLKLTYNYPYFTIYKEIGGSKMSYLYEYEYEENYQQVDTSNQYVDIINGKRYLNNKYYVPESTLHKAYEKITEGYVRPTVNWEYFLVLTYLAFGLSLLIFSFRVTSARSWLINLVALGVVNMILGITSVLFSSEYFYFGVMVALFLGLLIHFFIVLSRNRGKGITGITLNSILWMFAGLVPAIYLLLMEIAKRTTGYYNYDSLAPTAPSVKFFEDHALDMAWINLVWMFVFMVLFLMTIKKWRGLAES